LSMHDVIIIGSGPAGWTAAVYATRSNLKTLMISGSQAGGQLMLTSDVENYPGFADPILGPELMENMRKQAERLGAEVLVDDVSRVDFKRRPFRVWVREKAFDAETVIIATGASAKWLGLPSEQHLLGHGVSSCATCDGFFFRGKKVVVVGGGDTAMEDALYLAKIVGGVTVIHRRDQLRASKIMQDRALKNPKINFVWDSVVEEVLGGDKVSGVRVKNVKTGEVSTIPCAGLFVAIGHEPNTGIFKDQIELDKRGYIHLHERTMTSVPGVFAAGDVDDPRYRQAVTAAGEGCRAAMDAEKYHEAHKAVSTTPTAQ
jgi:thioredoxin reductase (NADPH)